MALIREMEVWLANFVVRDDTFHQNDFLKVYMIFFKSWGSLWMIACLFAISTIKDSMLVCYLYYLWEGVKVHRSKYQAISSLLCVIQVSLGALACLWNVKHSVYLVCFIWKMLTTHKIVKGQKVYWMIWKIMIYWNVWNVYSNFNSFIASLTTAGWAVVRITFYFEKWIGREFN